MGPPLAEEPYTGCLVVQRKEVAYGPEPLTGGRIRWQNEEICKKTFFDMRRTAAAGYEHNGHCLTPEECLEVAQAIIDVSTRSGRLLDMRLLVNSYCDRLQWANGEAETHWLEPAESAQRADLVAGHPD